MGEGEGGKGHLFGSTDRSRPNAPTTKQAVVGIFLQGWRYLLLGCLGLGLWFLRGESWMVGGLFSGWGSMMNGWADTDGHPPPLDGMDGRWSEKENPSIFSLPGVVHMVFVFD